MKIIKPLSLGLLQRPYRRFGQNHLVAAVLGFFPLGEDLPARLLPEAPQWGRLLKVLPTGQALDEVMPKGCAEAMVLGQACAPGGKPVTRMEVRLQVGTVDKRLMVYGQRKWRYGTLPFYAVDAPAPFETMPLDWQHAFGGPGYLANPMGLGYDPNRLAAVAGANEAPMPNVEYAGVAVVSHTGSYAPAGLGPMPIDWDARKGHAGTYDQRWLQQDYPGLPRDLDWRLYNQAAADQRLEHWFTGGEDYCLEGMSAARPVIRGRLPTFRVRAFALSQGKAADLREFSLHLDTVWFLPGLGLGIAAWRGQLPVEDSDALDVRALMVAYEDNALDARSSAHYAQVLRLRMDATTAGLHAFNESQLAPMGAPSPAAPFDPRPQQARIDEATRQFWEQSGLAPPAGYTAPPAAAPLLQGPSTEAISSGDMDLTPLMQQVDALQADTLQKAAAQRDALQQQLAGLKDLLADAGPAASVTVPTQTGWQQVLSRADGSADARTTAALASASSPEALRKAQAALALNNKARHASPLPVAPAQPLPADLAAQLGRQVLAWVAQGLPLAGRDLAGADLRNADLAGLDLSGCLLEYADFTGAKLARARFCDAALTNAVFSQADLTGADLSGANLCGSVAAQACFAQANLRGVRASAASWAGARGPGADLSNAVLDRADLSAACFDGATLDCTVLAEAVLRGGSWRGAQATRCVAWKVQAQDADFSMSSWHRSAVIGSDLRASRWEGARLVQLQGGSTDWTQADLRSVRAERSSWPEGQLGGVNFSGAFLSSCDLSRADLNGATLDEGCFAKSLFMQAQIGGASARHADFFQALLRKADFTGADLREASLYQAELTEICLANARTEGLRLDARRVLR
jgi:uncharacterized protein YjbI with pentapeptide repeats